MARLPRQLWKKVVPDLSGTPFYPAISWLAVDGYAFDRAYFDTRRWVDKQIQPRPYPWAGYPAYFPRAVDQGIGRALWFIHGGRAADVAAAVRRFAEPRRADLWSGVGLAATFAGGCDPQELSELYETADSYRPEVGLGAVFAVKARHYAGFVPEHTVEAASAFGGLTIEEAVSIADRGTAVDAVEGPEPAYEIWRRRIRLELDPAARSLST
jgi:hypothetical protein